jgi:hypothetical protein
VTDKEFLNTQTRLAWRRMRRSSEALRDEIERAIAPAVREHPRKSLAAGALAGLLAGRVLAPAPGDGRGRAGSRRGPISGAWSFVKGTGVYALRASLIGMLLSGGVDRHAEEPSEG